jgi:hypothetical protein
MSSTEKLGKMPGKQEEPPMRRFRQSFSAVFGMSKKDLVPAEEDTTTTGARLYING